MDFYDLTIHMILLYKIYFLQYLFHLYLLLCIFVYDLFKEIQQQHLLNYDIFSIFQMLEKP